MAFKYYWKELSGDGLLKEPKGAGPYYSKEYLNKIGGFENKDEAIQAYEEFYKLHGKYYVDRELVLIEVYEVY